MHKQQRSCQVRPSVARMLVPGFEREVLTSQLLQLTTRILKIAMQQQRVDRQPVTWL